MSSTALEPALALMQLNDSLFPSGAFVQSYGLEQLARDGVVKTPEDVESFIRAQLHQSLATADAPATYIATIAAGNADLESLLMVDRALYRTKAAEEMRNASLSTGRRQLDEVEAYIEDETFAAYASQVRSDRTLGTQPVVFGAICSALDVPAMTAAAALILGAVSGLAQAAMRLLPVSHRDVQRLLHRLRPEIAAIADGLAVTKPLPLRAFNPSQEIASMRHEVAAARLFKS